MELKLWIKERELNARRIASRKTIADRSVWLEDANYFKDAYDAIEACSKSTTSIASIVQAAVIRALDEANVRNEVLRGMCVEVALEKARDMLEELK